MTKKEAEKLISENKRYTIKKERDVQLRALMAIYPGHFLKQKIVLCGVVPSMGSEDIIVTCEVWVRAGGHIRRCSANRELLLVAGKPPREGVLDCFRGGFCYEY